ncbi:MAG TPA: hypothetical protein VJ957_07645, partial [Longimicrobiales bacterium]|nr:hypothetical protein [Longimicrobiales bacterium]
MTRRVRRAAAVALCAVLASAPAAARAQTADGQQTPTLDQVEQLAQSGQYDKAREAIDAWWRATPDPPPADAVRGHLLRGRLTVDPDSAESDYLAI